MSDIILSAQNGQAVVSSLDIAEKFEKRHDHVMRDIDTFKKDVPNFGEMCPVLDRSMRRRGAQKSIGQKCPKFPSGGEAVKNWLFRSSEFYSKLSKRWAVNRRPLPVNVRICAA